MFCPPDLHKRSLRRQKHKLRHRRSGGLEAGQEAGPGPGEQCRETGRVREGELGESECEDDALQPLGFEDCAADSLEDLDDLQKPDELSHFSEEGIADMDIPDGILEELEFLDGITSCDKVENYLMLSEYEQNLIKEIEGPAVRGKGRKWSVP